MIPGLAKWDERKVKQVFSRNDAQSILSCPIANVKDEVLRWSHHHSGLYVTKTAHHWLEKQGWVQHAVSPIWKVLSKANVLPKGPFSTCLQWLEEASQVLDAHQLTFLLVLIWNVWNRRNRWVHQNQLIPPKLVADFAQMLIGDKLDSQNSMPPQNADRAALQWMKPELGWIKVNVDGAWLE
ncbi:hypothetical protein V6N13_057358 [Hibiscus sabdariffa]